MARLLSFLFFLQISFLSFSQNLFQNISFQAALQQSASSGKLIFIQFESASCDRCNEVADKAFENKELADQLRQTFICLKIDRSHPDRATIGELYNIKYSFGSLFIDHNKTLIHSFRKSTTFVNEYNNQIDIALTKAGEDIKLSELEKQFQNDDKNYLLLGTLLMKRNNLNLESDSLLEKYISIVPQDSIHSVDILQLIAQMAPVIGTHADAILRMDYPSFIKAWNLMSLPIRVSINNRIISKSNQKAIEEKNENYAIRVAVFARSTYTTPSAGSKAFESNLLTFYWHTNDTVKYLLAAVRFYDSYYMNISIDSLKNADLERIRKMPGQDSEVIRHGDSILVKRKLLFSPSSQIYSQALNNGALTFYKMTSDSFLIGKALQWAKRANEFFEDPDAMNTYAKLLYKTGSKTEAIEWEEKAIAIIKKRSFPPSGPYEEILSNMKKDKNKIDE